MGDSGRCLAMSGRAPDMIGTQRIRAPQTGTIKHSVSTSPRSRFPLHLPLDGPGYPPAHSLVPPAAWALQAQTMCPRKGRLFPLFLLGKFLVKVLFPGHLLWKVFSSSHRELIPSFTPWFVIHTSGAAVSIRPHVLCFVFS